MGLLPAQGFIKIFVLSLLVGVSLGKKGRLSVSYYDSTCSEADDLVYRTVREATSLDQKVPARLLRMFFHDCFIRGCDASVLLDSTQGNQAEKDTPPNLSLRAFHVIDEVKMKLEAACPRTVSCADILAMAARDAVVVAGGPYWKVRNGRKDGRVSIANETQNLPKPNFKVSQLIESFAQRGLSVEDLVALSGGHTLGVSNCSHIAHRIQTDSIDPTLDSKFAVKLQDECSMLNAVSRKSVILDSTVTMFDNNYFKRLTEGKGVLASDQDLYTDSRTRFLVKLFGRDKALFFREFVASMVRMGSVGIKGEDGEVRINCREVNKF